MISRHINLRNLLFILLTIIGVWVAFSPLRDLDASGQGGNYSHIPLIPLVSIFLIYQNRERIFSELRYSIITGLGLIICGILLLGIGRYLRNDLNLNDFAFFTVISIVLFWIGAFVFCYGTDAFRIAQFPLLFVFLMTPIPSALMDGIIYVLQVGSTEVTHLLFVTIGIPFARDGFVFQLPVINIEVAKECSGIRSSIALFITGILAGDYFLKSGWRKGVLLLAMLPITIIKNGIRIVTLSLLAIYVDTKFLTDSWLHHSGGFVFYIPALVLMGSILFYLRRAEKNEGSRSQDSGIRTERQGERNEEIGTGKRNAIRKKKWYLDWKF